MDWDRAKIKETLEILAQLPDFDNLLFPDSWASEFNIPITPGRVIDLKEYMRKHRASMIAPGSGKSEIRGVAEGGVREITVEDKLEIEHKVAIVNDDNKEIGFSLTEGVEPAKMLEDCTESMPELTQTAFSPTGTTEAAVPFDGNGATGE